MKRNIDEMARYLVEGSVWQNKHGKTYSVLFVSNLYISNKLRDRFIPSVTFINSDNDVFTLDCDTFLRMYEYVEVNDQLASILSDVYRCNNGELETTASVDQFIDELESGKEVESVEVEPEAEETPEVPAEKQENNQDNVLVGTLADQLANANSFLVDFIPGEGHPALTPAELAASFAGYSCSIDIEGNIFHKLYFVPTSKVIGYTLDKTFNPESYLDEANAYKGIHLNTGHTDQDIAWNTFGQITGEFLDKEYLVVTLVLTVEEESDNSQVEVTHETPEADPAQPTEGDVVESATEFVGEATEQTEQSVDSTEPVVDKIIAHLVKQYPTQAESEVTDVEVTAEPQTTPQVEVQPEQLEPSPEQVKIHLEHTASTEPSIDDYFDVVEITDSQAQDVAQQVVEGK